MLTGPHHIPAPGFERTQWAMPPSGPLRLIVQYANGMIHADHGYLAKDLRWSRTGDAWDVAAIKAA